MFPGYPALFRVFLDGLLFRFHALKVIADGGLGGGRHSAFITIHLVLSDRTRGLVGAPELALMKPSAVLVNTSRGPIVDEEALIEALRAGTIAGAGLDVFDNEPLPADHPLRSLPNTVLTGHTGYVMLENYALSYSDAVADIKGWLWLTGEKGTVDDVFVLHSDATHDLNVSALSAVRKWVFKAGRKGGIKVRGEMVIPVEFSMGSVKKKQ